MLCYVMLCCSPWQALETGTLRVKRRPAGPRPVPTFTVYIYIYIYIVALVYCIPLLHTFRLILQQWLAGLPGPGHVKTWLE